MLSGSSRSGRITLVIAGLNGGGAERVCVNLANAWVAQGRPVTIQTVFRKSRAPAYEIDPRVELRDVGWPRQATLAELNMPGIAAIARGLERAHSSILLAEITLIGSMRHAIRATHPDLVVAFIDMTNVRVLAAMQETGVPVIACEQTDTRYVGLGRCQHARWMLYRQAAAVVAPHSSTAQYLADRGARSYAIPNPLVAPPVIKPKQNNQRHRLVTLMRLSPEKRPDLLVRAFGKIAADFPDWDLDIYGLGSMHTYVAGLAQRLAPDQIHLRGFVRDNYAVLGDADLFASTSWIEGFGNAIWESLACGVPVIAMECGDPVRALIRDGIDGVIVRGGVAELAAALRALMGDDARRRALAARAPDVLTRFSYESSLEAWDSLINSVWNGARK